MTEVPSDVIAMCKEAVADDAALRTALNEAEVTPMLLVYAQLTGDENLVKEVAPYIHGPWSFQHSLPDVMRQKVIEALVEALKSCANSDGPSQFASSPATMTHLMGAAAGRPVPEEYIPLLMEEMQFDERQNREVQWRKNPTTLPIKDFKVVVIGAGVSGICAAIYLKKMGIPFVVYERNAGVGGTWLENCYPGCGVDTPTHFYSFSFSPKKDWSRHFPKRDEILSYVETVVADHGIQDYIKFETEVKSAEYDEERGCWKVNAIDAKGTTIEVECNVLISAAGYFNRPSIPQIKGIDDYKGDMFHTARWDYNINLNGKRVAMIGTGASAMQAGPAIAPDVGHLTIFQRQPHWALYNPNYNKEMSAGNIWAFEKIPYFAKWVRFQMFWASGDGFHASLHKDPNWDKSEISLNEENHKLREDIIAHARKELEDEELLAKVIPDFPPYGKRMLRENNWYKMLKRDNVDLETGRISHITETSIVMQDGTVHEADVIIWATGFSAGRMLWPIDIKGRNGLSIRDAWGDDNPSAYLGISVPGFPNLFVTAGPNTFWSHGGSMIFASECQVRYILQGLREMIENGITALEVKPSVHDAYNEHLHKKASEMVWTHPNVHSYYKNSRNRLTVLNPMRLVDYWKATKDFKIADFNVSKLQDTAARGTGGNRMRSQSNEFEFEQRQ